MNKNALCVIRVALGTTFIWIGIMILREPAAWAAFIQPWAAALLPAPILTMQATGALDVVVGLCLILGFFLPLATLIGSIHLLTVLVTVGINQTTVRDIGLFGTMVGLFWQTSQSILSRRAWMEFLQPKSKR